MEKTEIKELAEAQKFGIEQSKATELLGNLPQIKQERQVLAEQYNDVIQMDINQVQTSKTARELRLKIRDNRTKGIEVWHKNAKDFFLKGGQFVDSIKRMEVAENIRMEENLEQIEKHFEIQEAKRKEELRLSRVEILNPYQEFVPIGIDFGSISDEEFTKVLNGAKLQHEAKVEAERKAEEERVAKEKAEAEERERIRIDNERLKAEAEAKEKQLAEERAKAEAERKAIEEKAKKEREAAEAKLNAEREAARKEAEKAAAEKARLEAELKAKAEAEAAAEKARIDAEEKARKEAEKLAKAPIKKQLNVWVESFEIAASPVDNEAAAEIIEKFKAFKVWAKKEIEKL